MKQFDPTDWTTILGLALALGCSTAVIPDQNKGGPFGPGPHQPLGHRYYRQDIGREKGSPDNPKTVSLLIDHTLLRRNGLCREDQ